MRILHTSELRELKRRLDQRIPYEQVVQKARILRLQKDLDSIRATYLKTRGDNSKGLLDLSLSTVENLSKQIIDYEKENESLKSQLIYTINDRSNSIDRFHDGIIHIGSEALSYINELADNTWKHGNIFIEITRQAIRQQIDGNKVRLYYQIYICVFFSLC
jgi:hypothetical protein